MAIKAICPGCKRQVNAPDTAGGRTAKCPACGVLMIIPPAVAEAVVEPQPMYPQAPAMPQSFQAQPPYPYPMPPPQPQPSAMFSLDDEDEQLIEHRPRSRRKRSRDSSYESDSVTPSFGISALVVSIVSFVTCWIPLIGLTLSGLAFLLALVSFVRRESAGFAIAGLVMSVITGLFAALVTLGFISAVAHDAERTNRNQNAPWVR